MCLPYRKAETRFNSICAYADEHGVSAAEATRRLTPDDDHWGWFCQSARNGPEYTAYIGAKTRCGNPKTKNWKHYGGRGIEFRFKSFQDFMFHLGKKPGPEYSLDRIDNDGHYEAGNCRWATWSEQAKNKRPRAKRNG
jgi:hypothetical protein